MKEVIKTREIYLHESLLCVGFKATTNNANEVNLQGAIPQLWNTFFQSERFKARNTSPGVYFNYKNKHLSDYDILASVAATEQHSEFDNITIQNGKYLVFEKSGESPHAAFEFRSEIWNFFETSNRKRAYTTGFEKYISHDKVEIYISVL